jgi:uncharacterized RDD family membrane protein YckC
VSSTDQLKIDTPEQIALELPLAGIGSRFLGLAIDTLLQWVLYFVVFLLVLGAVLALFSSQGAEQHFNWIPKSYVVAVAILLVFCIYWGYFAFFEIIWKGQTPGKRVAGLRVIHTSGRPLNVYEAIGRNLLRAIDGFPYPTYGVGIVCMMLNDQHRRLGDYVAGTVVIHDKQTQMAMPDFATARLAPGAGPLDPLVDPLATREGLSPADVSASHLAQVTSEELVLIETFLERRFDLEPAVRDYTALQIASRITARTGLQPGPNESRERFLEIVARQVRDTARLR